MTGRRSAPPEAGASGRRSAEPGEPSPGADVGSGTVPRPAWVPTDGVITARPDRQVLVAGATPTGFALARLLVAAGYEPVLSIGAAPPPGSEVAYLPPAAVEVLGALDAGGRVLEHARRVTRATVRRGAAGADPVEGAVGAGPPDSRRALPVVVPTAALSRVLRSGIGDAVATDDRRLDAVSPGGGGIAVAFEDGVTETFDLVVDASGTVGGSGRPDRDGERYTLTQYEAVTDVDGDEDRIAEWWGPEAVVQRLPRAAEAGRHVRITAADPDASVPAVLRAAGPESGSVALPDAAAFSPARVEQVEVPDSGPASRWWGRGRIARCGPAACPAAPAAEAGPALGLADALGVVRAITREGVTVPDAVDSYADRRAARFADRRREATRSDLPTADAASPTEPLGSVYALRAVALGPFFGSAPAALRDAGGA